MTAPMIFAEIAMRRALDADDGKPVPPEPEPQAREDLQIGPTSPLASFACLPKAAPERTSPNFAWGPVSDSI
jgi:hypothetical protein